MKTCLSFLFLFSTVFGALPPLAQSVRELKALLADSHMQEWLGSAEWIQEISRTESGYAVITQNYSMQVDVIYKTSDAKWVGPAQFTLQFHKPVDLKTGETKVISFQDGARRNSCSSAGRWVEGRR